MSSYEKHFPTSTSTSSSRRQRQFGSENDSSSNFPPPYTYNTTTSTCSDQDQLDNLSSNTRHHKKMGDSIQVCSDKFCQNELLVERQKLEIIDLYNQLKLVCSERDSLICQVQHLKIGILSKDLELGRIGIDSSAGIIDTDADIEEIIVKNQHCETLNGDDDDATPVEDQQLQSIIPEPHVDEDIAIWEKPICITVDETIDIKGRKILNILAKVLKPNEKFLLIESKIIEEATAIVVASKVDDALISHNIKKENLMALISDNVAYMVLAGNKLKALCPRLTNSTCWAHILHLQSEDLRNEYDLADQFISAMKAALIKCPNRKHELLSAIKFYEYEVKLPPIPVITRWTTWLAAAQYHSDNSKAIIKFIQESKENSAAVKKLKELIEVEGMWEQLERMAKIYPGMKYSITTLEDDNLPACYVWANLLSVQKLLESCGLLSNKLDLYLKSKHPALNFWKDVVCLDPRKSSQIKDSIPESLQVFSKSPVPMDEIIRYKILSENSTQKPFKFWMDHSTELPILSELALSALSLPPSSASVERSFSQLKRILTPPRTSFTEENLAIHLKLAYNNIEFKDYLDLDEENE